MQHGRLRAIAGLLVLVATGLEAVPTTAAPTPARAYELVSPSTKIQDVGLYGVPLYPRVTADGDHIAYSSLTPLPGSSNGVRNDYRSTRTSDGWDTAALLPSQHAGGAPGAGGHIQVVLGASDDGQRVLYASDANLDPEDQDFNGAGNENDLYLREPDGAFTWVSKGTINVNDPTNSITAGWLSSDGTHVVFLSSAPLLPADASRTSGAGLYDWHAGSLSLVAVDSSGAPLSQNGADLGRYNSVDRENGPNAMSRDGSRVFFSVDGNLYVRINGRETRSVPNLPPAPSAQWFMGATPDGAHAYFATRDPLASGDGDANDDLYDWDVDAGTLRLVSVGSEPGAVSYLSGVQVSDDGRYVYFVSDGPLGTDDPPQDGANPHDYLYVSDSGALRYVAPVGTELAAPPVCGPDINWRVTPDGRHLVFATHVAVTPDDQDTSFDIFEYTAASGDVVHVSTGPAGGNAAVDVTTGLNYVACGTSNLGARATTDDGQHVFFETTEALVDGDTNGRSDVYEFTLADRRTTLVSAGTGSYDSHYLGSGATGRDVFFSTFDALVPQDRDVLNDVYDARAGGGFPQQPGDVSCEGDDCQAAPAGGSPAPSTPASTTTRYSQEKRAQRARPTVRILRSGAASVRRMARRGVLRVRVITSGPGRITLIGRSEFAHRARVVARTSANAQKGSGVTLSARLRHLARTRLRRGQSLTVRVTVSLAGASPRHVTLRLLPPHHRSTTPLGRKEA